MRQSLQHQSTHANFLQLPPPDEYGLTVATYRDVKSERRVHHNYCNFLIKTCKLMRCVCGINSSIVSLHASAAMILIGSTAPEKLVGFVCGSSETFNFSTLNSFRYRQRALRLQLSAITNLIGKCRSGDKEKSEQTL
jgi:hypothetical protein